MSDEQTYTKETLPGLYNSLRTHLDTLDAQIKSNQQQKENCERNLKGLNSDREVLAGRVEVLKTFTAKAHIQIKPILEDVKANPQAKAEDNMKVMLKKLVKEILEEEEQEMLAKLAGIPEGMDQEVFTELPEVYDKVKYIVTQMKEGKVTNIHQAYASLSPLDYSRDVVDATIDGLIVGEYIIQGPEEGKFKLK